GQSILLIAPVLLTWSVRQPIQLDWRQVLEITCLFVSVGITSYFVLIKPTAFAAQAKYVVTLFFVWSALSLGPRVTATALLYVAVLAVAGCITGSSVFFGQALHTQLLLLQTFMTTLSAAVMAVAAVTAEREHARD